VRQRSRILVGGWRESRGGRTKGWVRRAVGLLFDIVFEGSWDPFRKIGLRAVDRVAGIEESGENAKKTTQLVAIRVL
jgi:hypothetical protein